MSKDQLNIIQKIEHLVSENDKKPHSPNYEKLLKANENYNRLVNSKIFKKRGFTLRGIEDAHLLHQRVNG
jgi:hypothetical protein